MAVFVTVPSRKRTNTQAKEIKSAREKTPEEIKRERTRNRYKTVREGEIKKVRIKIHYITEKGSEKLVCTRA